MTPEAAQLLLAQLPDWEISVDGKVLRRRFRFKGYARGVAVAKLASEVAQEQGHHPDICFGWGYCEVGFTTHAASGLTENDFICAAKLQALLE